MFSIYFILGLWITETTRLKRRRLLITALDSDEEYLDEGEMSSCARTYAGDAVSKLQMMFALGKYARFSPPPSRQNPTFGH
jgi:hypothetical protein